MLKDRTTPTAQVLKFSISKGKAVTSIIKFLDSKLSGLVDDLKMGLQHEDDISQECCIYLGREARNEVFMFHFQHKYVGKQRSSDFAIISIEKFSSKDPLFVIEAKRLPTPGTARSREYVQGNLGGIERFKRNFHGANLGHSAMFGYVQANNSKYWHTQINSWITDLIDENNDIGISWTKSDQLKYVALLGNTYKCKSRHSRINQNEIKIVHYFILL